MKRVECTQCAKSFTKGNIKNAERALMMHVGRVHTGKISRGYIRRDSDSVAANHAHGHNGHNHELKMKTHRNSKLSREQRANILAFIREHRSEYSTKTGCFREAMKAAGVTGKIKETSVNVTRHFKMAELAAAQPAAPLAAAQPAAPLAVLAKPVKSKRQYFRGDVVDKVLAHHASPAAANNDCPNCHYDFNLLQTSKVPARYCPGCGTTVQTLINQLLSLLTP